MKVKTVDIKKLRINPITIKRYGKFNLSNDDDRELLESIITDGIFQRPVVTKNYLVIKGNRRVQAAKLCAKIKKIEVEVIDIEDDEVTEYIIVTYQISRTRDEITAALEYSLINEEKKIRQGRKGVREIIEKIRSEVVKSVKKSERTIKKVVQSVNFYKETNNCSDVEAWEFVTKEKRVNNKSIDRIFKETKEAYNKQKNIIIEDFPSEYKDEWFQVFRRNNQNLKDIIPDNYIDVSYSSPPYFGGIRDYLEDEPNNKGKVQQGQEKTPEEYIKNIMSSYKEAIRTLKDTGSLWVNIADSRKNGEIVDIPSMLSKAMKEEGMKYTQRILWVKKNPLPQVDKNVLQPSEEFILQFVKDVKNYKWKKDWVDSSDDFYEFILNIGKDNKKKSIPQKVKFKNVLFYPSDHKTNNGYGGTLITNTLNPKFIEKILKKKGLHLEHDAMSRLEPVLICILSTADAGDKILDPFHGMGHSGLVAIANGNFYFGIEKSSVYSKQSIVYMKEWINELIKKKQIVSSSL